MKSSLTIPLAIVVGGVVIATAVYITLAKPRAMTTTGNPALVRPVSATDHILGSPAAKVAVVEYADFDCEYCRGFNTTLHQIVASEGASGQVAVIFRHFPLTEIHPNALAHARAAECVASVAGNDAFWRFADALYARQPIDTSTYGTIASSVGISDDNFAQCYAVASSTLDAHIQADRQNALDIGATGTPYSLILVSGRAPVVVDGAYSYDDLKLLVDQALVQ